MTQQPIPDLATSGQVSDDSTVYTFALQLGRDLELPHGRPPCGAGLKRAHDPFPQNPENKVASCIAGIQQPA